MDTQPTIQAADYEQTLTSILQTLSIERVEQVVDFARFIQLQELSQRGVLHEDETEEEVRAESARWDATFAASRDKLRQLAREAREDIRAGRTMAMTFTEDDRIAPG